MARPKSLIVNFDVAYYLSGVGYSMCITTTPYHPLIERNITISYRRFSGFI